MKRIHVQLCLAVVILAGLGTTAYLQRDYSALARQIDAAREPVRRTDEVVATATEKREHSQSARSVAANPASDGEALIALARKHAEQREAALLIQPELQLLFEETRRNAHRADFAPLFRTLGLSEEEQDRVTRALANWDVTMRDVSAVMKQQRMPRHDPALQAMRSEAQAALDASLREVMGRDAIQVLGDYTRSIDARRYVAAFGGIVSRLGEPLSLEQADQLAAAFAEASGESAVPPERLTDAQWRAVLERSRQILSAGQWEVIASTTPPRTHGGRWQNALDHAITDAIEKQEKDGTHDDS